MDGLQRLVWTQVEIAQYELERLFLLDENEERADVVPPLPLHQLMDDPVNNQRGWNFLKNKRNRASLSTTGERWMLDRVLTSDSLREDFIEVRQGNSRAQWRAAYVAAYLKWVEQLLERLLLLIHITGVPPLRATELICIRHSNIINLFIPQALHDLRSYVAP